MSLTNTDKDDWFGMVRWCDGDIENAFEVLSIECSEERLSQVRRKLESHWFTDFMIERGWDYIYDTILSEIEQ